MSEEVVATPEKVKTEYEDVLMSDERIVKFAGKRQINKEPIIEQATGKAGVRFDFRNGTTFTIWNTELPAETQLQCLAHGLAQKCGDEAAGVKTGTADLASAVEDMMERLRRGEFYAERQAGDSFSGTSVAIRALAEVTGKSVEVAKAFLQGKLDAAKAAGKSLSRQELYASLRKPGTRTAEVIARLEAEDAAGKPGKVSADDLVSELAG